MEDFKQKWVEALRSGRYKQVQGTLKGKKEDGSVGYCCLGVALDIIGVRVRTESLDKYDTYSSEGSMGHYDRLDKKMPPEIKHRGIEMNDDGHSFEEIADMIEEEWKT